MKDKILIGLVIALILSLALNVGTVGTFIFLAVVKTEVHGPSDGLGEKLELTPEQKEKFKENREDMKEQAEPIRRELDEKRSEVIELLKEPEPDTARRDELFKEIASLQVQLEILVFDHMHETAQVLTPEQREVFFEHLECKFGPGRGPFEQRHPHLRGHYGGLHGPPHGYEEGLGRHGPPPGYEGKPPPPDTE
ncbi:MAG: periplasmic heavy metal sensor [Candidatus Coatesbacteria bacterium]|nr:MAG: periplasmic heavy metal sensor [Candidatus Coatesbacteria bacterium]